jgi:hypothetical protein
MLVIEYLGSVNVNENGKSSRRIMSVQKLPRRKHCGAAAIRPITDTSASNGRGRIGHEPPSRGFEVSGGCGPESTTEHGDESAGAVVAEGKGDVADAKTGAQQFECTQQPRLSLPSTETQASLGLKMPRKRAWAHAAARAKAGSSRLKPGDFEHVD